MLNRKTVSQFDFLLFVGAILLSILGLLAIYSATTQGAEAGLVQRQATFVCLGILVCLAVMLIDYHVLIDYAFVFYGACVVLLIAVLIFGTEINGSRSWIRVAGFGFQPSELVKVVLILALAKYLAELNEKYLNRRHIAVLAGLTLIPVILVTMQGDLGSALTFFPILLGPMLVSGLRLRFLVLVLILVICIAPVAWLTLKDYQKQRILVTFNPDLDPQGVGYQTRQSLIAIGSGGFAGKGFGNGLQSQLGFVPEIQSDFIFALLAEELGFLGGSLVLVLYLLGLLRLLRIGGLARDRAGILVVTGIASLICFHVVVNTGMTLGLMPAIGIPLPLLSHGGSATICTFLALGLALSIYRRRFIYSHV